MIGEKPTVGTIVGGGFSLFARHTNAVLVWLVLYLAASAVMAAISWPNMEAMIAYQKVAAERAAAGMAAVPMPFSPGMTLVMIVNNLGALVLYAVLFAAFVRATAWPADSRNAYLRFGADELSLIALGLVLVVGGMLAMVVAVIAGVILLLGVGLLLGKAAAVVLGLVLYVLAFGVLVWVQVRLSLVGAFTVLRRRIAIKEAWVATGGQFWRLFGAYLIVGLACLALSLLLLVIMMPGFLTAMAANDPAAMSAFMGRQMARFEQGLSFGLLLVWIAGAIVGMLTIVIGFGAVAKAAVLLAGDVSQTEDRTGNA